MTLVMALLSSALMSAQVAAPLPCDDPAADPWVAQMSSRLQSSDGLVAFATDVFGAPVACDGEVAGHLDGEPFGVLTLGFPGEVTFRFETMPPRVTVATLRADDGFDDSESVVAALRDYAEGLGLSIMWAAGSARMEGGEESEQFWDPDLALNASATITRAGDTLVAISLSKAP